MTVLHSLARIRSSYMYAFAFILIVKHEFQDKLGDVDKKQYSHFLFYLTHRILTKLSVGVE